LTLFPFGQLPVITDQATFGFRQWRPFKLNHFVQPFFDCCAIQHAYYSINCIAESALSGRDLALERGRDEYRACFVTS